MEGAVFYWVFWAIWVYVTFILDRQNPYRLKLAGIVLIAIIFSNSHFTFGRFEVAWSGLFLLLFAYSFLANEKYRVIIYHSICSLIVSIAYVSFHLFEIFDPVWIIFKKEWMISIGMSCLTIVLQKKVKGRLVIALSGTMQGEFLTAYILNKLQIPYSIAGFAYLDVCSLITALLVCWSILENASSFLQSHFPFLERTRQKSS